MITGVITTRDILGHPLTMIMAVGFLGYLHLLLKGLDRKPHRFVQLYFDMRKGVRM